jgi:uncharacterized protein (UPF0218 family)
MYILPENLREILKEPIGKLVDEKSLIELLKDESKIISVGDTVTYTLLKYDIEPLLAIVDYKTRRGPCDEETIEKIKSFSKKSIIVENPPGVISDELIEVLKISIENLDKGPYRLEIIGEEDLASMIALLFAPVDVTIIYGLPDKGVLVVKPTDENKVKVKEALEKMKK